MDVSAGSGSTVTIATRTLNEVLIRLAKGMVDAWEKWLKAQES